MKRSVRPNKRSLALRALASSLVVACAALQEENIGGKTVHEGLGAATAGRRLVQQEALPLLPPPAPPPPLPQQQPQQSAEPPLGVVVGRQARAERIEQTNRTCIVVPQGLLPGPVTLPGGTNLQPTFDACARSCLGSPKCLVFNWCPSNLTEPCPMAVAGGEPLPPGSCEHRSPAVVSEGNTVSLLESGPQVTSIGGAPMSIPALSLPGYTSLPGQVLLAQYRLSCPDLPSLRNDSCRLLGTAQELAAACDANPSCQAVEFSPLGRDGVNASLGSLKGTAGDRAAPLDLRRITWSPRAMLLVRDGVLVVPANAPPGASAAAQPADGGDSSGNGGGGLSAGAIAGIAVGSAAAVAAAAAAAVALLRHRRRRDRAGGSPQPPLLPVAKARGSREGQAAAESEHFDKDAIACSLKAVSPAGPGSQYGLQYARASPLPGGLPPEVLGRSGRSALPAAESELLPALLASSGGSRTATATEASAASGLPAAGPAPGLAPWALQLLSESTAGWEEALVRESEITFLRGQDGQPICLGTGAFGSVWKVVLGGHTLAAAKVVEWGDRARSQVEFIQEAALLRRLRHPNIVQFLSLSVSEQRGILLMEFCPGRDLDAAMHACSKTTGHRLFDWYNRGRKVSIEIASGLAYLHHRRILHLDLKPHNVLMASDGTAKIGDVGFARLMHRTHLTVSGRFGTFDWAAPEILMGRGATAKSDVYSFGVLLHGICTGEPPRRGQMPPLRVPEHCPAEVAALYQRCTSEDIDERPTASELLETLRRLPPARRPQHTGQDAPLTPPQLSLHDTVQGPAGRSGGAGGRSGRETTASQRPAAQVQQASGSAAPSQAGNSDLPSPFSAAAAAKPASRHGHASRRSRIRIPAPLRSFSWHPPDSDWASPFATARATLAEQPGVAATTAGAVEARSGSGAPRRASSWHTPAGSPTSPLATPAGIAGQPAVGLAAQPSS